MKRRSVLLSGVALSGTALANDSIFFSPLKYLGAEQQRSIDASRSLLDNLIPPSLPQYDNLAGKLARRAVLTSKKLVYVWTENFANVKGVPMARSVPLGELPNVDWLLKTAGVIVELIVNFVASLPASAAAQFERIAAGLSGDLEAARQVHEALLEEAKNDPAAAGSLLLRFTELQTRVIALLTRVGLLVDDILKSASNLVTQGGQGDGLNRFRAVFGTLRLPEVADSFRDDEAFAYWRVAGPNPLLIRRVDALPAKFPLGEEQFRRVMGADDSLLEAAASRRLYLLDYAELGKLAPSGAVDKLLTGTGFAYAPIALFALGKDRARLLPVAIQCGQDPATHPMFVRPAESESDLYWGWQMAKTVVQVAEENYHEMFVHLAQTHLVSEAFCLATQRTLAPSHPLHVLLAPHFEGTLFINEGAARILLPSAGFIDVMFAAPIQDTQATAGGNRLGFGGRVPPDHRSQPTGRGADHGDLHRLRAACGGQFSPAFDDDLRASDLRHERGAGTGLAKRQERGRLVEDDAADPGGAGEGEHLSPARFGLPWSPGRLPADRLPLRAGVLGQAGDRQRRPAGALPGTPEGGRGDHSHAQPGAPQALRVPVAEPDPGEHQYLRRRKRTGRPWAPRRS